MKVTASLIVGTLLAAGHAAAQDRADVDRTAIIGNRELPKVLYIVPWKKPMPGALSGRPVQSVLDEALAPVDREVFRRQVDYGTQLRQQWQTQATAKASAAAVPDPITPRQPVPTGESR
jgi:hypothetical protein